MVVNHKHRVNRTVPLETSEEVVESTVEVQKFIKELEAKKKRRHKNLVCNFCGKRFERGCALVMHTRTHQAKVKNKVKVVKQKKVKDDKDLDKKLQNLQNENVPDLIYEVINVDNDADNF